MANAVEESIEIPITEDVTTGTSEQNSFPMAIRELGEALFQNYEDKTSVLTEDNIQGMLKIEVLNDFMLAKYGFRYSVLDTLVREKKNLSLSKNGFGIEKLIEIVKSIQASFEQTQLPPTTLQKLMRR
jgi:hypothetical protein